MTTKKIDIGALSGILPARWTPMRHHPVQAAYWNSTHRFHTVPAGRRSGKTELAKRKLVKAVLAAVKEWPARYFAGAPTRDQAKRIYWDDLKALSPLDFVESISESDLSITYITGNQLWVVGMDKPQRIEGQPWDGGVLDEYANMKSHAWTANVRPALSDRLGWCDLIGVPEGRNHYYDIDKAARAMFAKYGAESDWRSFTWKSADILPPQEIEAAKHDLDELTYQQEYEASFINFTGRAYYPFDSDKHAAFPLKYNPAAPLIFCFDFNVEPGVAAVIQEQKLPNGLDGTGVIKEVHIPRNSSTPAVCRKLIHDWGTHRGRVICYGDATGGARGSAKVQGSDWDLIKAELRPVFGERLSFKVKQSNPRERVRVNAVNSRLLSKDGKIRLMVDPIYAPHVVKDFDGVALLEGGSGEIDKDKDTKLTHVSDAIGYYIEYEFPIVSNTAQRVGISGA